LRQSIWRLAGITLAITGIDALTGEPGDYETRGGSSGSSCSATELPRSSSRRTFRISMAHHDMMPSAADGCLRRHIRRRRRMGIAVWDAGVTV